MSITIGNPGVTGRNLGKIIGTNKGYAVRDIAHGSAGLASFSLGGRPSTFGVIEDNQVPAMGAGTLEKLITNIILDTGGNLSVRSFVNSVQVIIGNIDFVGIHETDLLQRAFVKDDLIRLGYNKSNNTGSLSVNSWIEVNYPSNELWGYSGLIQGQGANSYTPMFGVTNTNLFTNRSAVQRSLGKSGIIKDIAYYGSSPAGTGTTTINIEKNAVSEFLSSDLPVTGARVIRRFDDVNISFNKTDLLNWRMNGRVGTSFFGILCARIIFD